MSKHGQADVLFVMPKECGLGIMENQSKVRRTITAIIIIDFKVIITHCTKEREWVNLV